MKKPKIKLDDWTGCYPSNWRNRIVPDAMSHPAKYSSKLIRRIYEHLISEGWLKPGDIVLDPFAGVALGALDAMRLGIRYRGVELEKKFSDLGAMNISFWNKRFSGMPHWCSDAILLNVDSRKLTEILSGADAAISSPPYAGTIISYKDNGMNYRRPYMDGQENDYGTTEGQLGQMPAGDVDAVISSPPFRQSSGGTPKPKPGGPIDEALYKRHAAGNSAAEGYGATDGQMANMPEGNVDGVISSPPCDFARIGFEAGQPHCGRGDQYGGTDGQLGGADDFWSAAKLIVEQTYLVLKPGGHAVWVLKDFVKDKQRVPFCDNWRRLCESVGFVTLHEHHALLVRHNGTSHLLEGGTMEHKVSSKSFFRRVAESHGSPEINHETVFCMVK